MNTPTADAVLRHLERYLGVPERLSIARDLPGAEPLPVKIGLFADVPADGAVTCATIGLSEKVLRLEGGPVRQELVFTCYRPQLDDGVLDSIFTILHDLLARGEPLRHGVIHDLGAPLVPAASTEGLFTFPPVYFDENFARLDGEPPVFFTWLVPVTRPEIRFIEEHDWPAFDEHLDSADPDLLDLTRPSSLQ